MRIEWIVGLLGLVCWMTAGQEIQPDEITTEWFTTDAPVTMMSALDVTRPADREATALLPNDLRARILFNAEFEDAASQLAASQSGSTSPVGSTQLDNSLRSSTNNNNNDWTPIVWASTRLPLSSSSSTLPQATPLPSPVRQTVPPAAGPSTLIIRPTPLLRPVPTILATPGRVPTPSSTERMIASSIRPSSSSTEAPIVSLPPISFQPSIVHFDLQDASSGPNFTFIADPPQVNNNSIPVNQTAPLILADNSSLPAIILQDVRAEDDNVTLIAIEQQPVQIEEKSIVNITKESIPVNETILNETIVPFKNSTANVTTDEDNIVVPDDVMGNSSFVTQSSDNETVTIDEQLTREEEILTTPIEEDNSMTTDLSTSLNNDTNSFSATDEGNITTFVLLSTTDMPLPSTSLKAASVSTSVVTTTVTSQPDDEWLESTTDQELSNGNRQESGRSTTSTTLSALSSGLATLFPALTRPPSTTVIPTEINTKPITTTPPPPPTTTTHKVTTTTSSIIFPSSSGWTIAPQQAPPTPSIPHFVNPQSAGWPTSTHNPQTAGWPTHNPHATFHGTSNNFHGPTTTEYFPDNEWPSTEGSQADDYDSTTTIVAISVSIAVILCLAIAILLLLVLRRRRARAVQGTCQPARMDAYSLDNVSQSNTWQRGKVRNSLRASKRSYCNQAFDDSVIYIFLKLLSIGF